jgi:signal transduction histidine kinase
MVRWLQSIENSGLQRESDPGERRFIQITNRSAVLLILITLVFMLAVIVRFGWHPDITWPVTVVVFFTGIAIPLLNASGRPTLAKVLISVVPVFCALAFSLLNKAGKGYTPPSDYYAFRYILIGTALIPLLVFSTSQMRLMLICLAPSFLGLLLYEPIHHLFEVSYRDVGHEDIFYEMTTVVSLGVYTVLLSVMYSLKSLSRHFEAALAASNEGLQQQNRLLSEYQEQIQLQNEELRAQSDLLQHNNRQLAEANLLIDQQRSSLKEQVAEKTRNLSRANTELMLANNELRQFSFSVSHHLRGPTASARGLLQLFRPEKLDAEHRELYERLQGTVDRMEDVFRDLSQILSLRENLYHVNRRVVVAAEIGRTLDAVCSGSDREGLEINWDTARAPVFYTNSEKFDSILFHLISNAIKYRSALRDLKIEISTREKGKHYELTVRDNGMGIDLQQFGDKLFQLYQRFHLHREGKGLGLYLVKLQADSMGGFVEVDSREDEFTEFRVYLRKPAQLAEEVLLDRPELRVTFEAELNAILLNWKGDIGGDRYRELFSECIGFLNTYQTPLLIADVSSRSAFRDDDMNWVFGMLTQQSRQLNLQHLLIIDPNRPNLLRDVVTAHASSIVDRFGLRIRMAASLAEVRDQILRLGVLDAPPAGKYLAS